MWLDYGSKTLDKKILGSWRCLAVLSVFICFMKRAAGYAFAEYQGIAENDDHATSNSHLAPLPCSGIPD